MVEAGRSRVRGGKWRGLRAGAVFGSAVALLAAVCAGGLSASVRAEENIVIVLDASGSMAGRIGGKPKIDIARQAIEDVLATIRPDTRLGFVAYGHRRKGDCTDIETIYQVGQPDALAIRRAMGRLRPLGKTPLGAAVRRAAEALRYKESRATVILVSDGQENCGVDPCALGRELEAQGVDFTAHVIGFDVRRGEEAGLQCLARATGGRYVAAVDAKTLQKALTQTVKVAEAAKPAPPPVKAPKVAAIAGLVVKAVVSEGGAEWSGDLGLTLYSAKAGLDGKRKKIASAWRVKSGHVFRKLPPGRYLLQVTLPDHRHIARSTMVEVKPGAGQVVTVVLDIGQVRFDAVLEEGGKPFNWDLGWTVYDQKKDLAGKRRKIASFWRVKSGRVFWLPAGAWRVEGTLADARYIRVAKDITVKAGGGEAHTFVLDAGLVRFDARLGPESAAFKGDLGWTVLDPKRDLAGKRRKVASFWRVKSGRIFVLPAGEWVIAGTLPDYRHVWLEQTIKVAPGSEALHTFTFNAGTIRVDATVGGKPHKAQYGFTFYDPKRDLAGNRRKVAGYWRVGSGLIAILPAGRYVLEAILADKRATRGETSFALVPGEEKVVTVDLKAK